MVTNNTAPSLGTPSGSGANSTTKAAVLGYILGLATAGVIYIVTLGKGKPSKASRSACPMPQGGPSLLPSPPPAVDGYDNYGCTAEVPVNHNAPADVAKHKLSDEEVALIRDWYDGGVPVKEIASRLGISVKTVYARLKKNNNQQKPKQDD